MWLYDRMSIIAEIYDMYEFKDLQQTLCVNSQNMIPVPHLSYWLGSTQVLSKTWRKDRCFEDIIQTSLIVMTPNYWPLRFFYFTSPTVRIHFISQV